METQDDCDIFSPAKNDLKNGSSMASPANNYKAQTSQAQPDRSPLVEQEGSAVP